jgi:peptidoglycan hydrolase-like protein with peptidoglycan-binding domain
MATITFGTVAWPTLRQGDPHPQNKTAQFLIRAHGQQIAPDGIFGSRTRAAVRAFQASVNLVADGVVGRRTWAAMVIVVRRGSSGDAVRAVQWQSEIRHGAGLPIDGDFGPRTEQYVLDFQYTLTQRFPGDGIAVDGIVGPVTWRAFAAGLEGLDGS